jgi:hypothetical protein
MIDLSKEAEEYRKKWLFLKSGNTINDTFIAGANSKYVRANIIHAKIDVLQTLRLGINDANTVTVFEIKSKIFELQQQLKQLENE